MDNTQLQRSILVEFFGLPWLESLVLKKNQLNGTLDIGSSYGSELQFIDLQNNSIDCVEATGYNKRLYLHNNPICENSEENNSSAPQVPSSSPSTPTNRNGFPKCSQVYKGRLETGLIVAIKRAKQGSLLGRNEFKSEIELLSVSRVYHKNVVSFVDFYYEQGELTLVYEFIQNGTLKDSLLDLGANRPTISEVVKEIESILQLSDSDDL
ncbi:hypothetical protein Pint_21923 [Pistacia integerrima]|uniref:Uncharacterized protein n=1 Tax=Pistacia integerrima TaxID=434235 RepID=A0ACC0YJC8_9ROSI|nr:hypothetical protein Pint_21923 [Pistacia integerrima]